MKISTEDINLLSGWVTSTPYPLPCQAHQGLALEKPAHRKLRKSLKSVHFHRFPHIAKPTQCHITHACRDGAGVGGGAELGVVRAAAGCERHKIKCLLSSLRTTSLTPASHGHSRLHTRFHTCLTRTPTYCAAPVASTPLDHDVRLIGKRH
ncbi:hypothetical protein E2C01_000909 [Portunus trituberculatus]|uniref:Uncharacterized protein n=1 Tax=Portunus trituberculatus TaxID=210409 RepID=A0A5B7CFW5_PORTR|nr:hypothetical protein [Portunus trituberculatus]